MMFFYNYSPYARTVKAIADYTDKDGFTRILYLFTLYIRVNPQKSVKSVFKFADISVRNMSNNFFKGKIFFPRARRAGAPLRRDGRR